MGKRAVTFVVDDEKDADVLEWLATQTNKSAAIRGAIRAYMRLRNGDTQEAVIREAVARELARLPDVVAATVHNALAGYQLAFAPQREGTGEENPELAARLDAQLDELFAD
ncbi:MAG: hypothetical protein DRI79_11080 [Chloroflexi bacterium]|nr:MAG: hypothetical protein DRI79_11080 [Chloroflexota bacterium]